jgi:hypothetical protein
MRHVAYAVASPPVATDNGSMGEAHSRPATSERDADAAMLFVG